jgi:hypothetical protein
MTLEILHPELDAGQMTSARSAYAPDYAGIEWTRASLPAHHQAWPVKRNKLIFVPGIDDACEALPHEITAYARCKPWVAPGRTIHFLCDLHADADAMTCSLIASGGIVKTGRRDSDFALTEQGRSARFVIGGDCFDKGPSNLRLLDLIAALSRRGAAPEILAGNHDLRLFVGLTYAGRQDDTRLSHLFARMGQKAVPLLKEVHDRFPPSGRPISDSRARRILFPAESWYEEFPGVARRIMPYARIDKEIRRIREKTVEMEARAATLGMTMGDIHHAVQVCRRIFLSPRGEYGWFFGRMKLALREGSYLLVHAGVDDIVAETLRLNGVEALNSWFRRLLATDPFELYNGPVGNCFRTKYRPTDWPLTARGVADMHAAGLYAVIHGHRNILHGQRIAIRDGLLNFECDASVDANTRMAEGLVGAGGAATLLRADGKVLGISTDYPYVKVFDPANHAALLTIA